MIKERADIRPQHFGWDVTGRVATITLNRPERKNPLTFDSYAELIATFRALTDVREIRAVVVTGAGSGIGLGIATLFAQQGSKVIGIGRRVDVLEAAMSGIRAEGGDAFAVPGDVSDESQVEAAVSAALIVYEARRQRTTAVVEGRP